MGNDEYFNEVMAYIRLLMGYDFINRLEFLLKKGLLLTGTLSSLYSLIHYGIQEIEQGLVLKDNVYYKFLDYIVKENNSPLEFLGSEIKSVYINMFDVIERIQSLGLVNDAKIIALDLIEEIPYQYTGSLYSAVDIITVLTRIISYENIGRKCGLLMSIYDITQCFPRKQCNYVNIDNVELDDIIQVLQVLLNILTESQQRTRFLEEIREIEYNRLADLARLIYHSENIGIVFDLGDFIKLLELDTLPQIILYNDNDKNVQDFVQEISSHSSATFIPLFSSEIPFSLYSLWLRETVFKRKRCTLNIEDTPLALIIKSMESTFKYITIDMIPSIRITGRDIYLQLNNNRIGLSDLKENLLKHYGPLEKIDESVKKSIGFYILSLLNA